MDLLLTERDERVLVLTFNRPEKHNAMNGAMRAELVAALRAAAVDPDVGCVVIRGAGRSFGSGADITPRPELGAIDYDVAVRQDIAGMSTWIDDWRVIWNMPQPVVAEVHGHCLGEAWDLALNCDLVVTADDASFGYPITRSLGSPMSHMFTYLAGPQWAKYLLCSGDTVDGATAARIGLALRSVPATQLHEVAMAMAHRMAGVPLELLAANKSIANKALELMGRSLLQQLAVENDAIAHKSDAVRRWYEIANTEGMKAALAAQEAGMA